MFHFIDVGTCIATLADWGCKELKAYLTLQYIKRIQPMES